VESFSLEETPVGELYPETPETLKI